MYWINSINHKFDLGEVTKASLIIYKQFMINKGNSPATRDNYISSIRKFFSWLQDNEYIKNNPAVTLEWERDRQGTFVKQALTVEQLFRLLDIHNLNTAISKRNYALTDLMGYTGLRCIEVSRLNVSDVIKAANRWHLQIQRKGSKEKSGLITVPFDRIKHIHEYWKYRSGDLKDDSPAFVNHSPRSDNTRLTPVGISRIIKSSLRKIGLDSSKYSAHSLRHGAATMAYYAGSEVWEIGRMLGHTRPGQTEHYIHCLGIESIDQGKAIDKINDYARKCKKNRQKRNKTRT